MAFNMIIEAVEMTAKALKMALSVYSMKMRRHRLYATLNVATQFDSFLKDAMMEILCLKTDAELIASLKKAGNVTHMSHPTV